MSGHKPQPAGRDRSEPYDPLRMAAVEIRTLATEMARAESRSEKVQKFQEASFFPEPIPAEVTLGDSVSTKAMSRAWVVAREGERLLLAYGVFIHRGKCDLVLPLPEGVRATVVGKIGSATHLRGRVHRVEFCADNAEDLSLLSEVETSRPPIGATPAMSGPTGAASGKGERLHGRVLLAEDTPDTQGLFSLFLRKAGADVSIAHNGTVALRMIEEARRLGRPYKLLVTDIQMPEMDGHSLVRAVRVSDKTLPIVAVTAMVSDDDRKRCLASGCNDYAGKPIDRPELVALCSRWMVA